MVIERMVIERQDGVVSGGFHSRLITSSNRNSLNRKWENRP